MRMYGGRVTREPRETRRETRDGKGGRREEGIGERRSRRAGPVSTEVARTSV